MIYYYYQIINFICLELIEDLHKISTKMILN